MRKVVKGNTIIFYDAELKATPAPYYECMRIEDPDITDEHCYVQTPRDIMNRLPYQKSNVTWRTENGVFIMQGWIEQPAKITVNLCRVLKNIK